MPLRGNVSKQIHPKMVPALVSIGKFNTTCRIEVKTTTRSNTGSASLLWKAIAGLEAIPCSKYDGSSQENRTVPLIEEIGFSSVRLAGYYPSIKPSNRCVMASGEILDIIGTTTDSKRISTTLTCRLVNPAAEAGV